MQMRDLPESVDSKYRFITIAAKRCEQLQKGARAKIKTSGMTKLTTVAMEEVLDDLIPFETEEYVPEDDGIQVEKVDF
jgi:DNA-directed RNA polymerase omega subunit